MSNKAGSDLDVFNNLAKKASDPPPGPARAAAPPARPNAKGKTLLGLPAPPMPSRAGGPPPMPSGPSQPSVPGRSMPPPPRQTARSMPPPPPPSSARIPGPAPGALSPAPKPPNSVDVDWDDEDEQTTVYDKGSSEDAAQALLRGSDHMPAPPPPVTRSPSIPPPMSRAALAPTRPVNRPPPPPVISAPQAAPPLPAGMVPDRRPMLMMGAIIVLLMAAAAFFFFPRAGSIIVTVSGPGNKPLDAVEIYLNGEQKCSSSPCTISGLKPDTYMLRARAAGHQPMADTAVSVTAGEKGVHNLTLARATGTGIKVIAEGTGLKLYVDGREIGPLPQELKDMEAGDHVIKVAGNERFETFEKRITVEPEQMQTIGPLKLKVLKGLATITAGPNSEDARVLLISGDDRRTLPRLPINLDIPTNRDHVIEATRKGFAKFRMPIRFENGQAETTIEVALTDVGSAVPEKAPPRDRPERTPSPRYTPPAPQAPSAGSATLNINSIPVSTVVLDGRPLGQTPKVGIKVSAGSHTVVFVSGKHRKAQTVNVPAGGTKTVAVRF